MAIFEDIVRRKLGFETKKEELDRRIGNYQINTQNALDYSIAKRNIDISRISEQIRQLERVIKDNQFFIDSYESIKAKAKEKIALGNSTIKGKIYDLNGNVLVAANYSTISSYKSSLTNRGASPQALSSYSRQMAEVQDKMWELYTTRVIIGNGVYPVGSGDFVDGLDIFTIYTQALNMMMAGRLRNEAREQVILSERFMMLINKAYATCMNANSILTLALGKLNNALEVLNSAQTSDEYARQVILDTRKMMESTLEYFRAKKSAEYLDTIDSIINRK